MRRFPLHRAALLVFAAALALVAGPARAGLYEELAGPGEDAATAEPAPLDAEAPAAATAPRPSESGPELFGTSILTDPREKKLLDPRLDPILLIRAVWVTTEQEKGIVVTDESGMESELKTMNMDPSLFGHREGFVLENVELGMKGRFNDSGFYYGAKFDLVPREKDGNRSSDYLKDAYLGWNRFRFADIRLGRMKIPFSQVNNKSTAKRPLVYSPTLNTLIPKRQLGAMLSLGDHWGVVRLKGGVYNSLAAAQEQITKTAQLLYVGRVELHVDDILEAALSGDALAGLERVGFDLEGGINVAKVEANYDPPTKHRWFGVDGKLHIWPLTTEAEVVSKDFYYEETDPQTGDLLLVAERGWGWHTDVTIHAWPDVIDITGRIEEMDGDSQEKGLNTSLTISETSKQRKRWLTAGISLKLSRSALLSFNYINRRELEGYRFDNDVWLIMAQFDL